MNKLRESSQKIGMPACCCRPWQLLLPLLLMGASILGCNLSRQESPIPSGSVQAATQTAQSAGVFSNLAGFSTLTAQASVPISTSIRPASSPTTSTTPTASASATAPLASETSLPVARPVYFQAGGTSAYFQNWVSAGSPLVFTLRAAEGQTLILTVTSEHHDVFLDVKGLEDGSHLVWAANAVPYWFGTLTKTQTYQISLTTSNPGTPVFFAVEIPADIHLPEGADTASIDGYVAVHTDFHPSVMTRVRNLVHGTAGQTMTIELKSPHLDALSLGITGQEDGQPYLRYVVKNTGGSFVLPSTQGYYLDVYATGGLSTEFTLNITIR